MAETVRQAWITITGANLEIEKAQCADEGKDLAPVADEFERLAGVDLAEPTNQRAAEALLDETIRLPIREDYAYVEPSDLAGIRAERGVGPELPALSLTDAHLEDKVYGAWLGRVCGCLLGKPVEGWRRPRMWGYLKDAGRWPLDDYFTRAVGDEIAQRYQLGAARALIDDVSFMPEDDDTNYTATGMCIVKAHGADFTPADVALFWLGNIPMLHTCTAERVAYRNLAMGIDPPASATFRNVYREWIGAQIRADFFGYAAPGEPARAAEFAWRDACISHVKNGIYGEMWVAAMLAAAFVADDVRTVIEAGLAQIPARSRLHEDVRTVLGWHGDGVEYDEAVERIHGRWDEDSGHHWCHTDSNAMIVAVGLLWGECDYGRSICRAVGPCFDTDCNGATVGSIVGLILGAKALPGKWTAPVNDTLATGVAGYHRVKISDLAAETLAIIDKVAG